MRQLDTKFVRSRASCVWSKARDSTSERLGSRRFPKTVWVLSQLHNFVQPTIFNDLAQEAVSLWPVLRSLLNAADALGAKGAIDGPLFLVRHSLMLRDIARNVDLPQKDESRAGGADAYSITDTLTAVLSRTSTLIPGAFFASLPCVCAEHLSDEKRAIDKDLKRACETVISTASEPLRAPLRAFTRRPDSAGEAAVLEDAFGTACARDLRASLALIRLYVPDGRTASVLVQHARGPVDIGNKTLSPNKIYTLEDDQAKARAKELKMSTCWSNPDHTVTRPDPSIRSSSSMSS